MPPRADWEAVRKIYVATGSGEKISNEMRPTGNLLMERQRERDE